MIAVYDVDFIKRITDFLASDASEFRCDFQHQMHPTISTEHHSGGWRVSP